MRILIATPLFPPDLGGAAPYVKELAGRLAKSHDVTVITYGRLPEKIEGVKIIAIDKGHSLPVRLFQFTRALLREARGADVIFAENGPSVELPFIIVSFIRKTKIIFHMGDSAAHRFASAHPLRRMIERGASSRARASLEETPLMRPEIIPFENYPQDKFVAYEASWDSHTKKLGELLHHA